MSARTAPAWPALLALVLVLGCGSSAEHPPGAVSGSGAAGARGLFRKRRTGAHRSIG
jgi:hypothetical protein